MTKFNDGIPAGSRFTSRLVRTDTSAFLDVDINGYGVPPVTGTPNASFTISLMGAPADFMVGTGVFLRATGFTGFQRYDGSACTEPAGTANVFDPTQSEIEFEWFLPNESYTPTVTPNIPTAWRDRNKAYGKQIALVWTASGNKEVTCFAHDSRGNWGFASYTFQAGGNSPTIVTQDSVYATTRTIVWSQSSNWTGEPTGAVRCTTIAEVHAAMRTVFSSTNKHCRVLLRRGETFTDVGYFDVSSNSAGFPGGTTYNYRDNVKGLVLGAFGTGARPIIRNLAFGGWNIRIPDRADVRQLIVQDIDFQGNYDATKETGKTSAVYQAEPTLCMTVFNRVRTSGHGIPFLLQSGAAEGAVVNAPHIIHDCEVTNWKDYGLQFPRGYFFAVIDSDVYQALDALTGINHGQGGQGDFTMGNTHSCVRWVSLFDSYIARTSFYNRGGWSINGNTAATVFPPTNEQGLRLFPFFGSPGAGQAIDARRHHHNWDRVSIEGGQSPIGIGATFNNDSAATTNVFPCNFLWDRGIIVGGAMSATELIGAGMPGLTLRNMLLYRFNIPNQGGNQIPREIGVWAASPMVVTGRGPTRFVNVTAINLAPSESMSSDYAPFRVSSAYDAGSGAFNCVVQTPSRSVDIPAPSAPLASTPLAGFVCRYKPLRWNFPVVGGLSFTPITVGSARQAETGTSGNVAPGEWLRISYPDYTGFCRGNNASGPLGQVTRAIVVGNSTQIHEVSIVGVATKRMTDSALWSNGDGLVTFDFPVGQTYFRVRNNTATAWPAASNIWVKLDLTDSLMPGKSGTGTEGQTLPAPRPLAGSSALSTGNTLPRALSDFFGTRKPGSRLNTGAIVPGLASQGAFEP